MDMGNKIEVSIVQELYVPNFVNDVSNFVNDVPNFVKDVPMLPKSIMRWGTTFNNYGNGDKCPVSSRIRCIKFFKRCTKFCKGCTNVVKVRYEMRNDLQ